MPLRARYDGYADWYEGWNKSHAERYASEVRDLLGPGQGRCLDLGCGGGHYFDVIAATGRTVVGLDYSADQLRFARNRSRRIVRGDAAALPFADATFPTVASMWISTDVDDFAAVLAEVARVLTPGGRLVFYGAHPCFNGPHTEWMDDGGMRAHPTYRLADWHPESPWWGQYVRRRVGMRHHPLADLLNAFLAAGLEFEHIAELGDRPVPNILGIRARKPAGQRLENPLWIPGVDGGADASGGEPAAAGLRLGAIGAAYLEFAREEPGLFATAFALPQQHAYGTPGDGPGRDRTPLGQLRAALDELVEAGVLRPERRDGIEYPIWSAVHGLAVLAGSGPLRDVPEATRRRLEELTFAFIGEGLAGG